MIRHLVILILSGLVAVSSAYAALETPDQAVREPAHAVPKLHRQQGAAICVPPEPQYFSTFIRDFDGTIVGIRYDIVEYVC